MKDNFSTDGRGEWFSDDSRALHSLCTLFLLFLHQLHLRASGIRSQGLGTPALDISALGFLKVYRRPGGFRGHEPNENGWSKDS